MRVSLAVLCLAALVACGSPAAPAATATPDRRGQLMTQLDEYETWELAPGNMPREAFLAQRPLLQGYVLYWLARQKRANNAPYASFQIDNYAVAMLYQPAQYIADYLAGR